MDVDIHRTLNYIRMYINILIGSYLWDYLEQMYKTLLLAPSSVI